MDDIKMSAFNFMGILEHVLRKNKLYISPANKSFYFNYCDDSFQLL